MALEKVTTTDKIEIVGEFKAVQVRTKIAILEDGNEISSSFERTVVNAADTYSGENADVAAICSLLHTDEIKAAYSEALN